MFYRDTTLYPQNFQEEIKQWTNVFGVSETPTLTQTNSPLSGYTRTTYGPNVQAILAQGVGHTVPEQANDVLTWFGLIGGSSTTTSVPVSSGTSTTVSSTTVTSSSPSSSSTSSPGTAAHWAQVCELVDKPP